MIKEDKLGIALWEVGPLLKYPLIQETFKY